jgi:hypothetical protein
MTFSEKFDRTGQSTGKTVVSMEYVEGDGTTADDCDFRRLYDRLAELGVYDENDENWRVRCNRPVIIDCGGQ